MSRTVSAALAVIAAAGLAACASGGGGGSPPPAPAPTPSPAPATPQPFAFSSLSATYAGGSAGGLSVGAPTASDVEVTITEPDSPSLNRIDQVNFSGNETIRIRRGSDGFDQTFPASSYQGVSMTSYLQPGSHAVNFRYLERSSWAVGSKTLSIYKLNEGPSSQYDTNTTNTLDYVAVAEASSGASGSYQAFGLQTSPADMYRSGTLRYDGEAVGRLFEASAYPDGRPFVASALVTADFGKANNQIFAQIYNGKYPDQFNTPFPTGPDKPSLPAILYTATISGSSFQGATTSPGYVGSIQGAFYGPSTAPADEVGGTFGLTAVAPGGIKVVGAFAAGR